MKEQLGWRIPRELKNQYVDLINIKEGTKQNRLGNAIAKLMKLELAVNGCSEYMDDPEVKAMLESLGEKLSCTLTHTQEPDIKKSRDSNIDLFAQAFIKEYKDRKQVTKSELSYFASFSQGVSDHRSIQNRINYLVGSGLLEAVAPNVFNVKKGSMLGF